MHLQSEYMAHYEYMVHYEFLPSKNLYFVSIVTTNHLTSMQASPVAMLEKLSQISTLLLFKAKNILPVQVRLSL